MLFMLKFCSYIGRKVHHSFVDMLFPSINVFHTLLMIPRPRKNPVEGGGRDLVCPIILKQLNPVLNQEEENTDDEDDTCFKDIIRIGKNPDFIMFFIISSSSWLSRVP